MYADVWENDAGKVSCRHTCSKTFLVYNNFSFYLFKYILFAVWKLCFLLFCFFPLAAGTNKFHCAVCNCACDK